MNSKDEKNIILFIGEGKTPEGQIADTIEENFFKSVKSKNIKFYFYGKDIYTLYKKLEEDEFNTEIVQLLIDSETELKKKNELIRIKNGVTQIYLFFDYDGQSQKGNKTCSDDDISKMIEYFQEATDEGKLYISYPMIEAVKDFKKSDSCDRLCTVPAKENIEYKTLIDAESDFKHISKLTRDYWLTISLYTLKKSGCVTGSIYRTPEDYRQYQKLCSQDNIFKSQLSKIIKDDKIYVISAFPFFLIDYFGENLYIDITNSNSYSKVLEIAESLQCTEK